MFTIKTKVEMSNHVEGQSVSPNDAKPVLPAVVDAIEFIADALGDELHLRQMIDQWCIGQLGNTDKALEKADAMFTAARDIFYGFGNGR